MSNLSQYLGGGFNADEIASDDNYDNSPLPKGEYYVEVESAKTQETKNGAGVGLNVQFNVLGSVADNSHAGRKLFNWFNLQHSNEKAAEIGRREFAALCQAIGKPTPEDSDELIGTPLVVRVDIDKRDAERNVIKAYKAADAAPAPAAPKPAPAATAAPKKPWEV